MLLLFICGMADWGDLSLPEQLTQVGSIPMAKVTVLLEVRGLDTTGSEKRQRSRLVSALARELARTQDEETSDPGSDAEGQTKPIAARTSLKSTVQPAGAAEGSTGREGVEMSGVPTAGELPPGDMSRAATDPTQKLLDEMTKGLAVMQGRIIGHVAEQMAQLRDEMAQEVADQERRLVGLLTASRNGVDGRLLPSGTRQESTNPR